MTKCANCGGFHGVREVRVIGSGGSVSLCNPCALALITDLPYFHARSWHPSASSANTGEA